LGGEAVLHLPPHLPLDLVPQSMRQRHPALLLL